MIATRNEIKTILGISASDYAKDTQIDAILPMVSNDLIEYCNNTFIGQMITFSGECTITASAGVYRINCADGGMDVANFAIGDTIHLSGSTRDDGYLTIAGINANYFTIVEPLTANTTATPMTINITTFPMALKIYLAKMIGYQLFHANDSGITSESIGNYSYSRAQGTTDSGYPAEILRGLDKWKNVSTKRGSILPQFRDYRGYTTSLSGKVALV
jgi:hypothetical protein